MPAFYEIMFLPEGRIEEFAGSRGNYYEFEDGTHLDLHSCPVWCHHCGQITHGEDIESIDELDKRLSDLNDPHSEVCSFMMRPLVPALQGPDFLDRFRLERIEEARKRRQWTLGRRSPPKCIHCGSVQILLLPHGQQVAIADRPNALSVVVRCEGMCSTVFNEWFFTPEGDRIARDTKPKYWRRRLPDVGEHDEK